MDEPRNRRAIGLRVREIRKQAGLNQIDVADAINMNRATYSQYETGYIDLPVSRLILICDVLHTTPNAVLGYGQSGQAEMAVTRSRELICQLAALMGLTVVEDEAPAAGDPSNQQDTAPV